MLVEAWLLKALQVSIQKKPGKVLGKMYRIEDMNLRRQDVTRHANVKSAIVKFSEVMKGAPSKTEGREILAML